MNWYCNNCVTLSLNTRKTQQGINPHINVPIFEYSKKCWKYLNSVCVTEDALVIYIRENKYSQFHLSFAYCISLSPIYWEFRKNPLIGNIFFKQDELLFSTYTNQQVIFWEKTLNGVVILDISEMLDGMLLTNVKHSIKYLWMWYIVLCVHVYPSRLNNHQSLGMQEGRPR